MAVGLLAATLLAVSPVHILVNSRIVWPSSIAPLFTTAGLWLLARATRRAERRSFAAAGLVLGFALQTHPSVVGLPPGVAAWVVWRARPLLCSRWGALAILLGGLGCSNLIAYNLMTGFGSVSEALAKADAYATQLAGRPDYLRTLALELGG